MPGSSSDVLPPQNGMDADDMEEILEDGEDAMDVEHVANEVEQNFVGCLNHSAGGLGSIEPDVDDVIAQLLVTEMGSSGRSRIRERRAGFRRIVSEIYSPARVTQMIKDKKMRHVMPGFAFDITVADPEDGLPWDFSVKSKRDRARALLREQKPFMLIGSPMCTHFSTW